jgi:hypothetical protein
MPDSQEQIAEKQRILGEVQSRLKALDRIKRELSAQAQILQHQLQEMKKTGGQAGSGGRERRATSRRQGNLVSVTITKPADHGASGTESHTMNGWVMNRSGGGLCLLSDEEVSPGTVLTVTPNLGPTTFEWIRVEVKSCRPERKSWLLGCQFLEKLSWDDLRPFG